MFPTTSLLFGLLAACSPDKGDGETGSAGETADTSNTGDSSDTDTDTDTDSGGHESGDTALASLHGTAPQVAVTMPDFSATNRDGTARGPADLTGHPTALWFYPAAFTSG